MSSRKRRKKKIEPVILVIDHAKEAREESRRLFGMKVSVKFVDRKKKKNKEECRDNPREDDEQN